MIYLETITFRTINEGVMYLQLYLCFQFITAVLIYDLSRKVGHEVLCSFIFQQCRNYFSKSRLIFWASIFLLLIFTQITIQ